MRSEVTGYENLRKRITMSQEKFIEKIEEM